MGSTGSRVCGFGASDEEAARLAGLDADGNIISKEGGVDAEVVPYDPLGWQEPGRHISTPHETVASIARMYRKDEDVLRRGNPDLRFETQTDAETGEVTVLERLVPGQLVRIPHDERDEMRWMWQWAERGAADAQFELAMAYRTRRELIDRVLAEDKEIAEERQGYFKPPEPVEEANGGGDEQVADSAGEAGSDEESDDRWRPPRVDKAELPYVSAEFDLLRKAAEAEHVEAMWELGTIYFERPEVVTTCLPHHEKEEKLYVVREAEQLRKEAQVRKLEKQRTSSRLGLARTTSLLLMDEGDGEDMVEEEEDPVKAKKRLWRGESAEYKRHAAILFQRAAQEGHSDAAAQLAQMYVDGKGVKRQYKKAAFWFEHAGMSEEDAAEYVARLHTLGAENGDSKHAMQLARMYIDGLGVPMDFDKATFWFNRAGKNDIYAKRQIEKKRDSLRSYYHELFVAHDSSGNDAMSKTDFMGFYRDCLMAKGFSKQRADAETVSPYMGVMKSDSMYSDYDVNSDGSISFDEIWQLRGKVSTLIPKTEKHFQSAIAFFTRWRRMREQAEEQGTLDEHEERMRVENPLRRRQSSRKGSSGRRSST